MNSYATFERDAAAIRRRMRNANRQVLKRILVFGLCVTVGALIWIGLFTALSWLSGALLSEPAPRYERTTIDTRATDVNGVGAAWVLEVKR